MAGNFQEAARWFTQLWNPGADPTAAARSAAGAIPSMMMPTMDVKELEKRISDLRSVEHWLDLNLSLLRTTIQGMEMQRGTLVAWQGLSAAASDAAAGSGTAKPAPGAGAAENPAFSPVIWWNALQQQFAQMAASASAAAASGSTAPDSAPATEGKSPTPGAKSATGKSKS